MLDYLPNLTVPIAKEDARLISPLVLAFVGDGVETLYVRTHFVLTTTLSTNNLHKLTSDKVKAVSQAEQLDKIMDILTEEELAIYKRARNSSPNTIAKNATVADYKKASGLEALIGYLYLIGEHDRLNNLLKISMEEK